MSGMTLGGMLEAERRLRAYELESWRRRRMREVEERVRRDEEVWERWEGLIGERKAVGDEERGKGSIGNSGGGGEEMELGGEKDGER